LKSAGCKHPDGCIPTLLISPNLSAENWAYEFFKWEDSCSESILEMCIFLHLTWGGFDAVLYWTDTAVKL